MTDTLTGEQRVRCPLRTDAVGAALRRVFASGSDLPDDMAALLRKLDQVRMRRR